jgi:hypothetical protein
MRVFNKDAVVWLIDHSDFIGIFFIENLVKKMG